MGSGNLLPLRVCTSLLLLVLLSSFSPAAASNATGSADGSGDEPTTKARVVSETVTVHAASASTAMTRTTEVATTTQQSEESSPVKISTIVAASVGGGLFAIVMLLFAVTMRAGQKSFSGARKKQPHVPTSQRKLLGNETTPPPSPYSKSDKAIQQEFSYDQKLEQGGQHEVFFDSEPAQTSNPPAQQRSDSSLPQTSNDARPVHREVQHDVSYSGASRGPELNPVPAPAITVVQPAGFDLPARRVSAVFESIVTSNPTSGGLTWDWPSFDDIAQPSHA